MVKNQGGKFRSNEFKKNPYSGGYKERPDTHFYFGDDGYEETDNWECSPACPVGLLDGQSGLLSSGAHTINKKSEDRNTVFGKGLSGNASGIYFANSGGASRFFKQVTSREELDRYFQSMVRSK